MLGYSLFEVVALTNASKAVTPLRVAISGSCESENARKLCSVLKSHRNLNLATTANTKTIPNTEKFDAVVDFKQNDEVFVTVKDAQLMSVIQDVIQSEVAKQKQEAIDRHEFSEKELFPFKIYGEPLGGIKALISLIENTCLVLGVTIFPYGVIIAVNEIFAQDFQRKTYETSLLIPAKRLTFIAKLLAVTVAAWIPVALFFVSLYASFALAERLTLSEPTLSFRAYLQLAGLLALYLLNLAILEALVMLTLRTSRLSGFLLTTITGLGQVLTLTALAMNASLTIQSALIPILNLILVGKAIFAHTLSTYLWAIAIGETAVLDLVLLSLAYAFFKGDEPRAALKQLLNRRFT
jgi:hypothetical protein